MPSINHVHPLGITLLDEEEFSMMIFRRLALSPCRRVLSGFAAASGTEVIGNLKASSRLTDLATKIPKASTTFASCVGTFLTKQNFVVEYLGTN